MKKVLDIFNYISYLAYPLMALSIFLIYMPFFSEVEQPLTYQSQGLLVMGFALALVSLKQQKESSKLNLFVAKKPIILRSYVLILGFIMIAGSLFGMYTYFNAEKAILREMALGIFSLSLGGFGVLKGVIEGVKKAEAQLSGDS
ncbi:MAG: hypothetical protein AAFO07_21120 [Bacteroidota bacterium]